MSKRTGKSITLTDLLEEIPVDAVRFLFNMREAGSQMDFDLDLAVETSSQNPVYYCQYAHARICSILKNPPLREQSFVTLQTKSLFFFPLLKSVSLSVTLPLLPMKSYFPQRTTTRQESHAML